MDEAAVTAITGAVDFGTVITGIGAVGAAGILVVVSMVGLRKLLGAVKGL